jgi:hypothetical protein
MAKLMELKTPKSIVKIVDPGMKTRVTIYLTAQEARDAKIVAAQMGLHLANLGREAIRRLIYVSPNPEAEIGEPR